MSVDEKRLVERDLIFEKKRQEALEKNLNCEFIRINNSRENYDAFDAISRVSAYIAGSFKKKKTKKSLTDDLSKRLLGLKFKSNHLIKSKCLKWIIIIYCQHYKK